MQEITVYIFKHLFKNSQIVSDAAMYVPQPSFYFKNQLFFPEGDSLA